MTIERLEAFPQQTCYRLVRQPLLEEETQKYIPLSPPSLSSPTSNDARPQHDLRFLSLGLEEEGDLGALGI